LIYLDTSVALAHLLSEDRCPPREIWQEAILSSRLLEYELWNRIHARGLSATHESTVHSLLDRIYWLEFTRPILARALEPFPLAIRTLDALHLASLEYVRRWGFDVQLATYDERMRAAAREMGIVLFELD
jgi:predicted nucleic acid-binding protein